MAPTTPPMRDVLSDHEFLESARLLASLRERLAAVPHPALSAVSGGTAIDPETLRSLKALGYIQ